MLTALVRFEPPIFPRCPHFSCIIVSEYIPPVRTTNSRRRNLKRPTPVEHLRRRALRGHVPGQSAPERRVGKVIGLSVTTVDQVELLLQEKLGRPLTERELWELCLAVELDWERYFYGVGGVPHEPQPEDYTEHDLHWHSDRHTRRECPSNTS